MGACVCLTYEYAYIYMYLYILIYEFSVKSGKCCMGQGMGGQSRAGGAACIACLLLMGKSPWGQCGGRSTGSLASPVCSAGISPEQNKEMGRKYRRSRETGEMQRGSDTGNLGRRRDQGGTCVQSHPGRWERMKCLEEREGKRHIFEGQAMGR